MSPRSVRKLDDFQDITNPLDNIEIVLESHNWEYNRSSETDLIVQVAGKKCNYRLFFIWAEELNVLQFCAQFELTVLNENLESARAALMDINEDMIIGHFDLPRETGVPSFRHSCLLRGMSNDAGLEHLEDLIDISLTLCEKNFPALSLLSGKDTTDPRQLDLALMETVGES